MNNGMNNVKIDMMDDTYDRESLKVTCIERRYRVSNSKTEFTVVAKKEFDEDTTKGLLREDMELKTFLANYEISNVKTALNRDETPVRNDDMKVISGHVRTKSRSNIRFCSGKQGALKRREMFDSLGLQETFLVKDYVCALKSKGIEITNSAMPYDDLYSLEKQGKIEITGRNDRGAMTFKIKKNEVDGSIQQPS